MGRRPPGVVKRCASTALVVTALALAYFVPPSSWSAASGTPAGDTYASRTDGFLNVHTAASLVHERDLDLDEYETDAVRLHYTNAKANGHSFGYYPWPVAIFAVPGVLVTDLAAELGLGDDTLTRIEAGLSMPVQVAVAGALTAVGAVTLAFGLTDGTSRRRRAVMLVAVALATPLWSVAARGLWPSTAGFVLMVPLLLRARTAEAAAAVSLGGGLVTGALAGAVIAVRPAAAVMLAPVGLAVAIAGSRRHLVGLAGGFTATVSLVLVVNRAVYGSWLPLYYGLGETRVALHDEFARGLGANLISPARGLLVFSPLAIFALVGMVRALWSDTGFTLGRAAAVGVAGHLLLVSAFWDTWWAGHSYGPRFWVDAIPMLALLAVAGYAAVERHWPKLACSGAAVFIGWGAFVHGQGGVIADSWCWNDLPVNVDHDPDRVFDWADPQFLAGVAAVSDQGLADALVGPCRF